MPFLSPRECTSVLLENIFLLVGGGVQLGLLGTAATNRPIVPAPGDYDDGKLVE
jgi:hypothetical protein